MSGVPRAAASAASGLARRARLAETLCAPSVPLLVRHASSAAAPAPSEAAPLPANLRFDRKTRDMLREAAQPTGEPAPDAGVARRLPAHQRACGSVAVAVRTHTTPPASSPVHAHACLPCALSSCPPAAEPPAPALMDAAELPVVSFLTGAPTGATVRLDARVFGAPLRPDIVHRVIVWQQKNARTTAYKTKTRAEVNGGGRKPWKQKGTGRARHGSIRSPIWKGGGRAHGPVLRDWSISLPKRVRRLGLRVALSAKYVDRRLLVVESLAMTVADSGAAAAAGANSSAAAEGALAPIVEGKTRALEALLARHGLVGKRVVFIDGPGHPPDAFRRAVRNIPRAKPLPAGGANVQDIVGAEVLVVTPAAIEALSAHLLLDFYTPEAATAGAGPAGSQDQQQAQQLA